MQIGFAASVCFANTLQEWLIAEQFFRHHRKKRRSQIIGHRGRQPYGILTEGDARWTSSNLLLFNTCGEPTESDDYENAASGIYVGGSVDCRRDHGRLSGRRHSTVQFVGR